MFKILNSEQYINISKLNAIYVIRTQSPPLSQPASLSPHGNSMRYKLHASYDETNKGQEDSPNHMPDRAGVETEIQSLCS